MSGTVLASCMSGTASEVCLFRQCLLIWMLRVHLHLNAVVLSRLSSQTAEAGKSSAKQSAEATLSMFKRGGRIQARPKPGEAAAAGSAGSSSSGGQSGGQRKGPVSQLEQLTGGLERKVANCLSCGKIFDCRSLTNDIIAFIRECYSGCCCRVLCGFGCSACCFASLMTSSRSYVSVTAGAGP